MTNHLKLHGSQRFNHRLNMNFFFRHAYFFAGDQCIILFFLNFRWRTANVWGFNGCGYILGWTSHLQRSLSPLQPPTALPAALCMTPRTHTETNLLRWSLGTYQASAVVFSLFCFIVCFLTAVGPFESNKGIHHTQGSWMLGWRPNAALQVAVKDEETIKQAYLASGSCNLHWHDTETPRHRDTETRISSLRSICQSGFKIKFHAEGSEAKLQGRPLTEIKKWPGAEFCTRTTCHPLRLQSQVNCLLYNANSQQKFSHGKKNQMKPRWASGGQNEETNINQKLWGKLVEMQRQSRGTESR